MRTGIWLIAAFAVSVSVMWAAVGLNVWGGYTSFAMDDVNNFLQDSVGSAGAITKVRNGILAGADAMFPVVKVPGLSIGPRIEYLACNEGSASNATTRVTEQQYLIPLLFAGRYTLQSQGNIRLTANAAFGLGLGFAKTDIQTTAADAVNASNRYAGANFVAELGGGAAYAVSSAIDIGLDIGYRFAYMGSLGTGDYGGDSSGGTYSYGPAAPIKKAKLANPRTGSPVKYDFSGVMINIGATYHF